MFDAVAPLAHRPQRRTCPRRPLPGSVRRFYEMVHSPEFQTHLSVSAGQLLIMNNWRTMHGRAGLKGKARTILGGTVTREAFYSAVRTMEQEELGVPPEVECGVPTAAYPYVAARPEARLRVGFNDQQRAASA
eukprot:849765-Pleurochrysis_carterae.AAC.1